MMVVVLQLGSDEERVDVTIGRSEWERNDGTTFSLSITRG